MLTFPAAGLSGTLWRQLRLLSVGEAIKERCQRGLNGFEGVNLRGADGDPVVEAISDIGAGGWRFGWAQAFDGGLEIGGCLEGCGFEGVELGLLFGCYLDAVAEADEADFHGFLPTAQIEEIGAATAMIGTAGTVLALMIAPGIAVILTGLELGLGRDGRSWLGEGWSCGGEACRDG